MGILDALKIHLYVEQSYMLCSSANVAGVSG